MIRSTITVAVIVCLTFLGAGSAFAGTTYPVMNTSEYPPDGVYFRAGPDWNQTARAAGHGVYANDRVELLCWQSGSNVPRRDGRSNTVWYQARNVTRPTAPGGRANNGWINAHFVNDGTGPGQVAPGVPACGGSPIPTPPVVRPTPPPAVPGCYDGLKWSKHTLTYTYGGAHRYLGNVYRAVADWNDANVGVVVKPAARGQTADIAFVDTYDRRNDLVLGTTLIPNKGKGSPTLPTKPANVGLPITILLNQAAMDSSKFRNAKEKDFGRTYAAAHELGHALGLAHPGDCGQGGVDSIMQEGTRFFTNPPTFNTPRTYDRRALQALFRF